MTAAAEVNIWKGVRYTLPEHEQHLRVVRDLSRILVLCIGRRWGKTYQAHLVFIDRFLRKLWARYEEVERGEVAPWGGIGLARNQARRQLDGVVQASIVAPARKQLSEIRGLIETRLRASGATIYLHPDSKLAYCERPAETWFLVGEAAGVIHYAVGSRASQIVGNETALLWLNECSELDDETWRVAKPLLWEWNADVIAEGNPAFDEGHWYTALAISGLPDGHERADRQIEARNPEVTTYLGSATAAYSKRVREESAKDKERSGADELYVRWQIEGDWRLPGVYVFKWQADRHLATITETGYRWSIRVNGLELEVTDEVELIGGIDWFRGSAPAGAIVLAVWRQHPLDAEETRPLVLAVDEMNTKKGETYSDDGFIEQLVALQTRWGVDRWYQDPFSPRLTKLAKAEGLAIKDTNPAEKLGRLALLGRLLHCDEDLEPCLYVSTRCKTLADQLSRYKWARKKDGRSTGKPIQYNDWLLDAAAYVMPHILGGGASGGGLG